jgi:class 3 adenylate cyclase
MGDGLLVEFASVVDAVRCAVDVQCEMAVRNTDVPADRRIEFRIGINLGDIIKAGREIYGDGVDVAARLEALATPGAHHCAVDRGRNRRPSLGRPLRRRGTCSWTAPVRMLTGAIDMDFSRIPDVGALNLS